MGFSGLQADSGNHRLALKRIKTRSNSLMLSLILSGGNHRLALKRIKTVASPGDRANHPGRWESPPRFEED